MTQLDAPETSGPPQAHFPNVDDSIVVGIANVHDYHQRDYDTGELKYWPDGGKVMGKCITGIVVSTTGATDCGGEKSGTHPVNPGDLVTFYAEGGKHFTYRDAIKAHGAVSVGDVMQWRRVEDEPPNNPRHNPRKVYVAQIRGPKPDDGDLQQRCADAHRELTAQKLDEAPPADGPGPQGEPF